MKMETNPADCDNNADIEHACSYTALPEQPLLETSPSRQRPFKRIAVILITSIIFLMSLVAIIITPSANEPSESQQVNRPPETVSFSNASRPFLPRGVAEGVSAKSNPFVSDQASYNWTNSMLYWQRTAYHFQPEKNWMNDPNGPMFYKGWYHIFYQYNPDSAIWGNITWGHAVSKDLVHWLYLPLAIVPDHPYDKNGVWSGSATFLPNGRIVMIYTGDNESKVQVQCVAYPANLSDPLLLHWVKYSGNPVLTPPPGISTLEFRDPTTAWIGPDGKWRIAIGSKVGATGLALLYKTLDFVNYTLEDHYLHAVPGTDMWESVDFYPVSLNDSKGLETSVNGAGVKHVLKASLDDLKFDHYAIGTYFSGNDTWVPDDPEMDVGVGLRYDYGRFYAAKSFYDQSTERRILWGWINETDTETDDLKKGWCSVQSIPRTILFDQKTKANLLQWPVEEVESLRASNESIDFKEVLVTPGSVVPLDIGMATQLDIFADFEVESLGLQDKNNSKNGSCGVSVKRSALGPFGLLLIAEETLSELTPIYFRLHNINGTAKTYFCADETRSSKAPLILNGVYGSQVPVLGNETLSMRVLVDHSVIESFGQGGRTVITSRVYPTEAIYGAARLFLFNNATGINVKATLKIWQLKSADIHPFFHLDTSSMR